MRLEMPDDTALMNYLARCVYRGYVLEFKTVLDIDPDDEPVTGWLVGIDQDNYQISDINRFYRTVFIARAHVVSVKEMLQNDGTPFSIDSIKDLRKRKDVYKFTKIIRRRAEMIINELEQESEEEQ